MGDWVGATAVDGYWNLRLANTTESIDGDYNTSLDMGDVFIRANSILYIKEVEWKKKTTQSNNSLVFWPTQKYNIYATCLKLANYVYQLNIDQAHI